MVIQFPLRRAAEPDDDFERKLAVILPFADHPEALCQLLADCLIRLERLEAAEPTPLKA